METRARHLMEFWSPSHVRIHGCRVSANFLAGSIMVLECGNIFTKALVDLLPMPHHVSVEQGPIFVRDSSTMMVADQGTKFRGSYRNTPTSAAYRVSLSLASTSQSCVGM